jgi:hypothetical protein
MLTRVLGLAAGLLSFTASAQAQLFSIPDGTVGLTPIAGKITAVEQRRVPLGDAIMGSETRVTLQFNLAGCLDQLMPLVTHSEVRGRRVTLYVTALNAHNQRSQTARCIAIPQASSQVAIPGVFQRNQIQVVFLGKADSSAVTSGNSAIRKPL